MAIQGWKNVLLLAALGTLGHMMVAQSLLFAAGADCDKAKTPVEKLICGTPELRQLDREVGVLYSKLKSKTTPKTKPEFIKQQKDWLSRRDSACAGGGDSSCLLKFYSDRKDELKSIEAKLTDDDTLVDVSPVILKGRWKVGTVLDPEGNKAVDPALIKKTLILAGLPQEGMTVTGRAGEICYDEKNCHSVGWSKTSLASVVGGSRLSAASKLSPDTTVFEGCMTAQNCLTLIMRPDRHILASFGLCGENATDCRNGFQDWAPAEQ